MSMIDGILFTLLSTVACLALPKLLSLILANKSKGNETSQSAVTSQ